MLKRHHIESQLHEKGPESQLLTNNLALLVGEKLAPHQPTNSCRKEGAPHLYLLANHKLCTKEGFSGTATTSLQAATRKWKIPADSPLSLPLCNPFLFAQVHLAEKNLWPHSFLGHLGFGQGRTIRMFHGPFLANELNIMRAHSLGRTIWQEGIGVHSLALPFIEVPLGPRE